MRKAARREYIPTNAAGIEPRRAKKEICSLIIQNGTLSAPIRKIAAPVYKLKLGFVGRLGF